jgi:hypothetical protein
MAKTRTRRPTNSPVTEFPAPPTDAEPQDAPVDTQDQPEREEPPAPAPRKDPLPRIREFFSGLQDISAADWGARYSVKVYRLAPIYDSTNVGSKKKYIMIYLAAPAPDEERIKRDCGSGRYRLYLNGKTSGTHKEAELAAVEIDILDPAFPPNLPVGDWLDEPKNRDWQWAKPLLEARQAKALQANTPAPAAASASLVEALEVIDQIQDKAAARERERTPPPDVRTQWDPAAQLQTIAGVAQQMAAALKSTPENPMSGFLQDQMTAMRAEIAAARARSDALMDKLLERASAPPPQQNSGMSAIKDLVTGVKDLLPSLKELWPNADEAIADRVVRSKMGPWQEFFAPVLPKLVDALGPILPGIMMSMGNSGNRPAGPPAQFAPGLPAPARPNPNMVPPQPQQQAHAPNLDEMLLNALTNDRDGGEFADSLIMLFGQQGQLMYRQAASLGEQGLLTLIQQRPIWNQLGPLQSKVTQFVHEFIEYGQEPAEEPPEGTEPPAADDKVVDLTGEPA